MKDTCKLRLYVGRIEKWLDFLGGIFEVNENYVHNVVSYMPLSLYLLPVVFWKR